MGKEDSTNLQVNGSATSSQEDSAGASRPYNDDIIISWPELHRDARYLCEILHGMGPWKGIIAITRGGLVPAALIARELDIRLVDTVCITSYGTSSSIEAEQQQGSLEVLKMIEGDGEGFFSSTTWSTLERRPPMCEKCFRRPTSPHFTQSLLAALL